MRFKLGGIKSVVPYDVMCMVFVCEGSIRFDWGTQLAYTPRVAKLHVKNTFDLHVEKAWKLLSSFVFCIARASRWSPERVMENRTKWRAQLARTKFLNWFCVFITKPHLTTGRHYYHVRHCSHVDSNNLWRFSQVSPARKYRILFISLSTTQISWFIPQVCAQVNLQWLLK